MKRQKKMELPIELRLASEKMAEGMSIKLMADSAGELSRRYMTESGTGKSLLTKSNEAVIYSLMRMPATFGAVSSALEQVCGASDFVPRSLLDTGAGTGAGSWAAAEMFNLDKITCLERENAMETVGHALMKESSEKVLREACWIKADLTAEAVEYERTGVVSEEADLVIASYVINEMAPEDRARVVRWLFACAKKMLVIVEPGTPAGSENIRRIRNLLLDEGAYIAAPCTHMDMCHMKNSDWCHFSCRVGRGKIHKLLKDGDAPYEDEKFSYIAVSREPVTGNGEEKGCLHHGRVLRHPLTEKGRIVLEICEKNGIVKKTVTKKDGELYKKAKKVHCGDTFPLKQEGN